MPIRARRDKGKANIVQNPPVLPVEIVSGRLSWSQQWNGNDITPRTGKRDGNVTIQGSIEYKDLLQADFDRVLAAYPKGTIITIEGFRFEVSRIQVNRKSERVNGNIFSIYSVQISLDEPPPILTEGILSDPKAEGFTVEDNVITGLSGVNDAKYRELVQSATVVNDLSEKQLELLAAGKKGTKAWTFSAKEVISDSGTIAIDDSGFNRTELRFDGSDRPPSGVLPPINVWTLKPPEIVVTPEYSEDYTLPPENTEVLRDTTDLFVNSGQTKVFKETTTWNGTPDKEIIRSYGFVYTYEEIHKGDGILFHDDPKQFWKQIEERITQYIYKSSGDITITANVFAPSEGSGTTRRRLSPIVHPDYEEFATAAVGRIIFHSKAKYLVEANTTGWQLVQLVRETDNRNTLYPDDPYVTAGLFDFKKIPLFHRRVYLLRPTREIEGANVPAPFTVQFEDYDNLEPRIRAKVSSTSISDDGKVPILMPETSYAEPFYITAEGEGVNSFVWADDPDAEIDPDVFIPGTNVVAPPKRFTTGQETRNETRRTILSNGKYSDRVSQYSSQNPGFDNVAETIMFRRVNGDPPSATVRLDVLEQSEQDVNRITFGDGFIRKYLITTPTRANRIPEGGSVSIQGVDNLGDAIAQVKRQLRQSSMQKNQTSLTVAWYYPKLRVKDVVRTDNDYFVPDGTWRTMHVSWALDFKGYNEKLGRVLCTTDGTKITRGLDQSIPVTYSVESEEVKSDGGTSGGDPTVEFEISGNEGQMGTVLPPLETRRNY
jgi:hypothetical protein